MAFTVSAEFGRAKALVKRSQRALSPSRLKANTLIAANAVKRDLKDRTPVGFTGKTKQSWFVSRIGHGWSVYNKSPVASYLDKGTKAHGATGGGYLFIPKTRRAHRVGARGVIAKRKSFKSGRDFVFVKRVRGIKAMKIVRINHIKRIYGETLERYIKKAIK
tara:strand:+ start:16262 stop:16747 length:486 start_codon:yes stop_codon:yes gene_type:complete